MGGTATPNRNPDRERQRFLEQLAEVRQDPKVKSLALLRAGDPELAKDALSEAYFAVARHGPKGIKDLRAYYCRTLINLVNDLRYQFGASLTDDVERVADSHQDRSGSRPRPRPVDESVCIHLLAEAWLEPFTTRRGELTAQVPGRSPDPLRYRAVIVTASERVLRANVTADVCDADSNSELTAAYPEWFAAPGSAENTRHQRFCRARADVRELLSSIVSRDDLYP